MAETIEIAALGLPEASEIGALLEQCPDIAAERYKDGEYLMREGEEGRDTFLVVRGSFVVEQARGGGEHGTPLNVQSIDDDAPAFIGEMAYLGDSARSASVRCSGAVHTLRLAPKHIDFILDELPALARVLARQFARRLRESNEIIRTYRAKFDMHAQTVFKQPGDIIIQAGTPADTLYQLLTGSVVRQAGGAETIIAADNSPADFLNARPFFTRGQNEATYRAKGSPILLAVEARSRVAAARNFPELVLGLIARAD